MLKGLLLQWYGSYYGGGEVGAVITQWQQAGIFDLVLPFLLIFAIIYGILEKTKLFKENKAINPVIGFIVALISIQFDVIPIFFSEIFPRVGIGLVILLISLIFLGFIIPKENWANYTLFGIGALILIVILVKTAGSLGWSTGYFFSQYWQTIAGGIFILVVLGVIVAASRPKEEFEKSASPLMRSLFNLER